ncbi:hypothetical protein [Methanoculleus sp. 7T]|jgi:hypothetical protein|uniref:hypothetical protein n=1 Tax=Methanoculleus sp. 7T TaxID=2937282 RepID=UPI0020BD726D|nr:hypothetical protein [Methanoculleus sp. 7T]MCK8519252.1 hypothetical protein [Methanoculleus sp. 7T]
MRKRILVDREEQEAMRGRVREVVTGSSGYDEIKKGLENLGFRAKEDKPALALWESGEHELFVMVHIDPDTGKLRDYEVMTFEEAEGFE